MRKRRGSTEPHVGFLLLQNMDLDKIFVISSMVQGLEYHGLMDTSDRVLRGSDHECKCLQLK